MNHQLSIGRKLAVASSSELLVIRAHLGSGGQGEVYRAQLGRQEVALKWYFPQAASAGQLRRLQRLVRDGAPSERFLWPHDLVQGSKSSGFGYTMALRPAGYHSLIDLVSGRIDPSFGAIARAAQQLADTFLTLHARGLCYGDISFGNIFLAPQTGDILVCDTDNIVPDGSAEFDVLGTMRFMAPEVVRGESSPNSDTDRYSLAVLLFYMLMIHHPLEGRGEHEIRCMDLPAMEKLYGHHPRFIFDPIDRSNAPVPGVHDTVMSYWKLYPAFLRDLFVRAFTDGLRDPRNGRVRESEWRAAMGKLVDSVQPCGCGADNFYDVEKLREAAAHTCWGCGAALMPPARIRLGEQVVVLSEGAQLFERHLHRFSSKTDARPLARVERDARKRLVMRNLDNLPWAVRAGAGYPEKLSPNAALVLQDQQVIEFGQVRGEVRI